MNELPKTFEPRAIEDRWYAHWEGEGLFRPDREDREPWTIVMPPPNVTGSLHIGHALDITLQDVLTRRERMRGKDALWVVGTDHAGIATQMVVERNLESQGIKRAEIGREAFLEHVWEWKAQSGGAITRQLRRLGASCDWANERFTMDEGFSRAVTKVFVELYKRGLAYRDKRLVNWDPKFQTAISDLEVETRDVQGKFWTLRYPLADGTGAIEVATTRPETMLADMAVAVHPDDERYKALIGTNIRQPITGRLIPIIADEHADPELGSGAVKITPGHDFNDFEVGKRAGFKPADMLNMFDAKGRVTQTADGLIPDNFFIDEERDVTVVIGSSSATPDRFERTERTETHREKISVGLDRFEARKKVVELLEAEGALVRVEDRVIPTPYGDRSGVVIEPWLTDQWYVDAARLVGPVMEATRKGDIKIVPESWSKTWFHWLENIQPWTVSRQLWWGHRIPAWYGPLADDRGVVTSFAQKIFVAEDEDQMRAQAREYYGPNVEITIETSQSAAFVHPRGLGDFRDHAVLFQDADVLDTWFSSALWPFATLGWPDETEDLKRHYPNDVLISGFDILFFWDARMAMQGIEFMGEAPWKTLYLHGLVRDAAGQKMSKSKGNTVDPLGLIDKYGADALRFTLAAMESQGRDIKLDEKRVEGYRNFATKLWNAARFLQMNGVGVSDSIFAPEAELPVNRWIIGEVVETLGKLDRAFDELRYDEMADAIYHFVWGTFCDWYVELIKGAFDEETKRVAAWAFDQILVMLHPLMPFITEELWHAMGERPYDLIVAKWPEPNWVKDERAAQTTRAAIDLISEIRSTRTELNVPPGAKVHFHVTRESDLGRKALYQYEESIKRLSRISMTLVSNTNDYEDSAMGKSVETVSARGGSASIDTIEISGRLQLAEIMNVRDEMERLSKAAQALEKELGGLTARLNNPDFLQRAKPEAVQKARADHEQKTAEVQRLRIRLERLG
jgi:valyl-tRNA synthetase